MQCVCRGGGKRGLGGKKGKTMGCLTVLRRDKKPLLLGNDMHGPGKPQFLFWENST